MKIGAHEPFRLENVCEKTANANREMRRKDGTQRLGRRKITPRRMKPAHAVTLSRIGFAAGMVCAAPFSKAFWACYLLGGLSDLLDGPLARRLHQQSAAGAKLDSAADLVFAAALLVVAVRDLHFPVEIWLCAVGIALLRLVSYGIGYGKYHTFLALHTRLNKFTGLLIFMFPILHVILGSGAAAAVLCVTALVSAAEELAITVQSEQLDRDCSGIFMLQNRRNDKR